MTITQAIRLAVLTGADAKAMRASLRAMTAVAGRLAEREYLAEAQAYADILRVKRLSAKARNVTD